MKRIPAAAAGLALAFTPMIGPGVAHADQFTWPSGTSKPIETVIARALSQRGVPYVYGGGGVSGPSNGIRPDSKSAPAATGTFPGGTALPGFAPAPGAVALPGTAITPGAAGTPGDGLAPGATTVGFDSSGLIQYAFAGAGIKMPRTSGEQCSVGRKVPPAQARRGDLICYGPNGSQSVALYLGNGQMIEGTEPVVTVSAARTSNMAPYLTRILES